MSLGLYWMSTEGKAATLRQRLPRLVYALVCAAIAPRGRAVSTARVAMRVSLVGVHHGVERARRNSTKAWRGPRPRFLRFPPGPPPRLPRPPPPPPTGLT